MGTRYLKSNESLLIHNPKMKGIPKEYKNEAENLLIQKANKRLFGFLPSAYLAHIYVLGAKNFSPERYEKKISLAESKYDTKISKSQRSKKQKSLAEKKNKKTDQLRLRLKDGNLLMKTGEKLAVFDSSMHSESSQRISLFLTTKGFFDNKVAYTSYTDRHKKTTVSYFVSTGSVYTLDSIQFDIPDSLIYRYVSNPSGLTSSLGKPYDQKKLEDERERVYNLLTDNGYFTFARQYVHFELDTFSLAGPSVLLTLSVYDPKEGQHRQFRVDSVIFSSQSSVSESQSEASVTEYAGTTYRFGGRKYNTRVLSKRLFIYPDNLYSRNKTLETQRQLSYLDAFKFVNINYDSISDNQLIANVFTSPLQRFQLSNEVGIVSASQQLPGPFINFGIKNRNMLGNLETTDLTANFSTQGLSNVYSVRGDQSLEYSLFQYGLQFGITFPQFIFPSNARFKRRIGAYNPQTRLASTLNYEDRTGEYERRRFETSLSYLWRFKNNRRYTFTPFTLSYIDVQKLEPKFIEFLDNQSLLGNGTLHAAFKSSVISSSSFESVVNRNEYGTSNKTSSLIRFFGESGGNLANLFGDDAIRRDSTFSLFKWVKFSTDIRSVKSLHEKASLAFRFNLGLAVPYYQQNMALPYDKRFYIGGSNSLRAWPLRRLGPGAYGITETALPGTGDMAQVNYQLEQGGDMILEMGLEYRRKIVSILDYALFLDAGNIWIITSDQNLLDAEGDDGKFRPGTFYKEIAMGAGAGLRLDFSYLIFRVDAGIQVFDPAQPLGHRFVLDDLSRLSMGRFTTEQINIFKNKTNINLGIGFPF